MAPALGKRDNLIYDDSTQSDTSMSVKSISINKNAGFTLVEIIVGIVVLGIALTIMTTLLFPQARQSVEPIFQVRAAELGQSLLDEIMGKSFNAASDRSGGRLRCDEDDADPCEPIPSCPAGSGLDREEFVSVGDYNCYTAFETALGEDVSGAYANFELSVSVYFSDAQGNPDATIPRRFKTVLVTVTTPTGQAFDFSAIRGNF